MLDVGLAVLHANSARASLPIEKDGTNVGRMAIESGDSKQAQTILDAVAPEIEKPGA
jgi:hypothetical protein